MLEESPATLDPAAELAELRTHNERLTRYLHALQKTHRALDVDQTLESVLDAAEELFGNTAAMIVLPSPDGRSRLVHAARGLSPEFRRLIERSDSPVVEALRESPVVSVTTGDDEEAVPMPAAMRAEARRCGIGGSLVFRLDHDGATLGALALHFPEYRAMCCAERAVAEIFAAQAASALAHARDYQAVDRLRHDQEVAQQRLQEIVDCLHDAVLVWDCRLNLIVANAAAYRFLTEVGWAVEGRPVKLPTAPETCPVHALLRDGKGSISRVIELVGRWFEVDCHPLRDGDGAITAVVEHIRDVTDHRRLQRDLARSEERIREAMSNAPAGLMLFDPETSTVVLANEMLGEMCGRPVGELVGRDWLSLFVAADQPRLREAADRLRAGTKRCEVEVAIDAAEPLPVSCMTGRIDYSDGASHVQVMLRDLRPRRRLEAQLAAQEKLAAIGQLASGVAHEIRNPLGIIAGALYDLEEVADCCNSEAAEDIRIAREEIRRVQEIINNVLDFARGGTVEHETVDLGALLEQTCALVRKSMASRNIELVCEVEGEPVLEASPGALRQVALNLLTNSFQATPDGGRVAVRAWAIDDRAVAMSVADTGAGMSPDVQAHIFNPFYTTKEPGQGTGLGLSIVYTTVRDHGGNIEVDSEPGRGTIITVRLPRRPSEPVADSGADPLAVAADQLAAPRGVRR